MSNKNEDEDNSNIGYAVMWLIGILIIGGIHLTIEYMKPKWNGRKIVWVRVFAVAFITLMFVLMIIGLYITR